MCSGALSERAALAGGISQTEKSDSFQSGSMCPTFPQRFSTKGFWTITRMGCKFDSLRARNSGSVTSNPLPGWPPARRASAWCATS